MFEKMANGDYRLAYNTARAALLNCPSVFVMMNDEMIRKAEIGDDTEIGGVPIVRDDSRCELTVCAVGKSGKNIMMVYDREWGAFRCAVNDSVTLKGARFFKVVPQDVPDFLHKATMF